MSVFDTLPHDKQRILEEHLRLVLEANERVNLTNIRTFEEGKVLHVEDSLSALEELTEAPEGLYGDIGSGAGYPGIPLAVASGRTTMLVDSRKRKMEEVGEIIGELGLSGQISTYAGRAELLARQEPGAFSVLTARALSSLAVLLELSSPLLEMGGMLVCYKAQISEEELAHAKGIQKKVGMRFKKDRRFLLDGQYQRCILSFEKTSKPTVKLPRKEGEAQRNPLS